MKDSIDFKFRGNTYSVKFPTAGQFIDIEKWKATLSNGLYGQMFSSRTKSSEYALDLIDVESYIMVLMPDIKKHFNVNSISELSLKDSKELIDEFKRQVHPFIKEWNDVVNDVFNEEEKDEKNEETKGE